MKDIVRLLNAMHDCEREIDEDCVEYCGYRDALNFAEFLQTIGLDFTEEQLKKCEDPIMAYFDVVDLLVDSYEDENRILVDLQQKLPDVDLSKYHVGLDAKLTAYYWCNSNLKSEEEFEKFTESFNQTEE